MWRYLFQQPEVAEAAVVEVACLERAHLRRGGQHAQPRQNAPHLRARHVPVVVSVGVISFTEYNASLTQLCLCLQIILKLISAEVLSCKF